MSVETTIGAKPKKKGGRRYFKLRSTPRFGRGPFSEENPPDDVVNSPYYWWFMFLRLHEGYKQTCLNNGKGDFAELYQDFGDVFSVNFKQWWSQDEIVDLFAEPVTDYQMWIAKAEHSLAPFDSDEVINLVVPLTWSRRGIKKRFAEIINKLVPPGERGISHERSDAKYKINTRWNISSFQNAYNVYVIKQAAIANGEKLTWADVGIRSGQGKLYDLKESDKFIRKKAELRALTPEQRQRNSDIPERRRVLSIVVQQQYKRALGFIEASASSEFPRLRKDDSKKTKVVADN